MASASREPQRGEIWAAHASAILPVLQAAAACSLVGLSEAMMSDKTSLESADPFKLPCRPCLIIDAKKGSLTYDVVVFTTCGRGSCAITQLSAHSQFFAVAVGETRPWPKHDSPVLNVLPAWPKSFETPSYAIAYIVSIPRSALVGRWYVKDELYKGARFFCDEDTVEELEAICDERISTHLLLSPEERASWDRTYEVSKLEWLAARPAETVLSTIASEVYAHRHAVSEQPRSAGRPAQDSGRREQHAYQPPPVTSRSHRPAQHPSLPSQMPTAATHRPDGVSNQPRPQASPTRMSQAGPRAADHPRAQEFPPLRDPLNCHDTVLQDSKEADTPDTTPTNSPSSLADSLSTSDSEASPGAGPACELHDDEPDGRNTAKDPANNLLLSLDGDDAETDAGTISYSQIVKGVGVPRAEPVALNMDVAAAEPQQGKKAKRNSRVNIFSVSLRMGAGTRTTLF